MFGVESDEPIPYFWQKMVMTQEKFDTCIWRNIAWVLILSSSLLFPMIWWKVSWYDVPCFVLFCFILQHIWLRGFTEPESYKEILEATSVDPIHRDQIKTMFCLLMSVTHAVKEWGMGKYKFYVIWNLCRARPAGACLISQEKGTCIHWHRGYM